ncbi:MAG: ABC transporter substrate-binding protein [Acidimicrobiales bacterium]
MTALVLVAGATSSTAATASASPSSTTLPGALGSVPPQTGAPANGGVVSIAEPPGGGPTYIFPIPPAANTSVDTLDEFDDYMWRALWWSPKGVAPVIDYSQSIGKPPVFSNDNKTVTIHLYPGWKWSDGTPITSKDLAFDYWIEEGAVKLSPANDGDYTPGLYPDNVSSVASPNPSTFVINFTKSYNQNFIFLQELGVLLPLPAHAWSKTSLTGKIIPFDNLASAKAIYKFLNKQSDDLSTYGSNPLWQVVDGPYKIKSFDPATDANTLVANPAYTGPVKPRITEIDDVSFTSVSAEFDQLLTGKLTVGFVDFSDLPQLHTLESDGYSVFGYPDFGFSYVAYNFKDPTGDFDNVISQLYVRQAFAHLQDEAAEIRSRGIFDGAAGEAYGPVPAAPVSPFTPSDATANPYPFSIPAAAKLLSAHGWKVVPNGTTTCQRPGTGAGRCGAGIPKGTSMGPWDLYYANNSPVTAAIDEAWASNLLQVGIKVTLISKTFNYVTGELSDVSNPANDKVWAMEDFGGFTDDYYPTTNELFNTTGSFNQGGFSLPQLDKDILNSEFSLNNRAVQTELSLVTAEQPGLFQPDEDRIEAFKDTLSGPAASFFDATQYQFSPEYWYFKK